MCLTRAQSALALWDLEDAQLSLAASRENIVFRVDAPDGAAYALRLHRPGYRSKAELVSELEWTSAMAAAGLTVPVPLPSRAGALVGCVDGQHCSLLSWLKGAPLGVAGTLEGIDDRAGMCRRIGALLARMHAASDGWTPPPGFERPAWDCDGLLGEAPLWGRFWEHPDLARDDRADFAAARRRAADELSQIAGDLDYGLIHADALAENILLTPDGPALIDFDDGGWGFRAFELATFLLRYLGAPDYPALRQALLLGYGRPDAAHALDLFILLRALSYVGWIQARLDTPWGPERSRRAIDTARPLVRAYLG